MNIILSKDLEPIGKVGDVVNVKEGFARNYLLPRKLAHIATPENLKRIEQQKTKQVAINAQKRNEAQELAEKLSKVSCTVTVEVNDLDKLYGSVTESEIVKALEIEGFSIDKKAIVLENPINDLGIFDIEIKLYPDVVAKMRLWVAKK